MRSLSSVNLPVMTVGSCYGLGGMWSTLFLFSNAAFHKLGQHFPHKPCEQGISGIPWSWICQWRNRYRRITIAMRNPLPWQTHYAIMKNRSERVFRALFTLPRVPTAWSSLTNLRVCLTTLLHRLQQFPSISSKLFSHFTWLRNSFLYV